MPAVLAQGQKYPEQREGNVAGAGTAPGMDPNLGGARLGPHCGVGDVTRGVGGTPAVGWEEEITCGMGGGDHPWDGGDITHAKWDRGDHQGSQLGWDSVSEGQPRVGHQGSWEGALGGEEALC